MCSNRKWIKQITIQYTQDKEYCTVMKLMLLKGIIMEKSFHILLN